MNAKRLLTFSTFYFLLSIFAFSQGSLTPPGAPAPTMKSLDQIEPRTIVNATNTPGDSGNSFIISQPGSYYLAGNITGVSGKNGISIQADNVTLDLNGFELIGVGGSLDGINMADGARSYGAIRNGSVRSWGGKGIFGGPDCQISHVRAAQNGGYGIAMGARAIVSECTAQGNSFIGINVDSDSTVSNCVSQGNLNRGFFANPGGVISHCTAQGNSLHGIFGNDNTTIIGCTARGTLLSPGGNAVGIALGNNCRVVDCVASGNITAGILGLGSLSNNVEGSIVADNGDGTHAAPGIQLDNASVVSHCTSRNNRGPGISVGNGSLVNDCGSKDNGGIGVSGGVVVEVSRCLVNGNTGLGINLADHATVTDCHVNGNTAGGIVVTNFSIVRACNVDYSGNTTSDGIQVTGGSNRIEGNNLTRNSNGIHVTGAGNLIICNSARGNNTNYNIVGSNRYGPVIDDTAGGTAAVSTNSAADTTQTTHPWANFAY